MPTLDYPATSTRPKRRAASLSIGPATADATHLAPLLHRAASPVGIVSMAAPLIPSVNQLRARGGELEGSASSEPSGSAHEPPPPQMPGDCGPLLGFSGAVLDPRPVSSAARARLSAASSASGLSAARPLEGSLSRRPPSRRRGPTRSAAPDDASAGASSRASVAISDSVASAASASALPPIPPQLPAMVCTPAPQELTRAAHRRSPQRRAARSTVTVSTAFSESIVGPPGSGSSDYVAVSMPTSGPSPGDRYRFHVEVEGNW